MIICEVCSREVPLMLDGRVAIHSSGPLLNDVCSGSWSKV